MQSQHRLYKFDNLKFLLILLVVIGHFSDLYVSNYSNMRSIFIFIYSFHMPLFLFITGLFQKRITNFRDIPIQKIIFYVFLIYFMKFLLFFVCSFFGIDESFGLLSGNEVYWYLSVVIFYILLTPFIEKINFWCLFIFSIVLGLFVGYDTTISDFMYLSRAVVFFPFYLLGYYYTDKREKLLEIYDRKIIQIISFVVVITFGIVCILKLDDIYKYRMLFTGRNPYFYITSFHCTYKHRLFTYCISFVISFCIMGIIPNKKIKIISNLGKRTLQIYVLHQIFVRFMLGVGFFDLLESIFGYGRYFELIYILLAVILTFFLSLNIFTYCINYFKKILFKNVEN